METRYWNTMLRSSTFAAFLVLLAVLFLVSTATAQETKRVKLFALIVGLEKYKDSAISGTPMASAAAQLYDFLIERRDLFADVRIALLLNERATKANIVKVLTQELSAAGQNDVVLIFMNAHGSHTPVEPGKFHFVPYDWDPKNPQSMLQLNDKKLFQNIKSERLLFATGSCYSGGFLQGLQARGEPPVDFLGEIEGRFGMSAAKADEVSWNSPKYGMDIFGFYLIKGLRGGAGDSQDGRITVKGLFDYLSREVSKETRGVQHPQLFMSKGNPDSTTIYSVPTYADKLEIKVQVFHETEDNLVQPLTDESVLKSGQHVGFAFKPNADCYVHIFWWDTSGNVGRLFPNPKLTEGTGFVKAGETYWLPKQGKNYWYVLDKNPGHETVYFVASRQRNPKIDQLFGELQSMGAPGRSANDRSKVAEQIEREINLMGFADYVEPVGGQQVAFSDKEKLFQELEAKIKVSNADAYFKWRFKHE
jgi:hypothetical protein